MRNRWFVPAMFVAAAFMLVATLAAGARLVTAQEATPDAVEGTQEILSHPAHIHTGTCDTLGDVVYPLNNVIEVGMTEMTGAMGTPEAGMAASPEAVGDRPEPGFITIVEVTLDELLATEHAINIHESPDNIQNYIACGDIAGEAVDGVVLIDLDELNDSGYSGEATLQDNLDGTTTVTIVLRRDGAMASPVASPAA